MVAAGSIPISDGSGRFQGERSSKVHVVSSPLSEAMTVTFSPDDRGRSSWRAWWDNIADSNGSRNQTLVEVTCDAISGKSPSQKCYYDVSAVDGLSSSVSVHAPRLQPCPGETLKSSILVKPNGDWECPLANRVSSQAQTADMPRLHLNSSQACLSNCSLLDTKETCCRLEFANPTSPNKSPKLKEGAPQAYAWAHDDVSSELQRGPLLTGNYAAIEELIVDPEFHLAAGPVLRGSRAEVASERTDP
ncbi:uncharacterized protein MYCGRDRAFT_97931 [Zymoseptoria tritici IPO323]|uniref:Uncharacterized protein n=1 Tax=Zymoseptoria tritici (strain CBS 115943 / IPO323) TaxID=336722 RepID=F9XRT8_ZYMTI|nr:uncharacterized protein MYCGRDRAFT_97931 [Zymoseptoria tritici IPO323]EGP82039.1 hypothetical protein MYCGRDRAFT_97931 [Zymoseptoria tritici IPO323]